MSNLCARCGEKEHDNWPNGNGGRLCQECWEVESDAMWWAMLANIEWPDLETVSEGRDVFEGEPVSGLPEAGNE